ncbi:MAG: DUF134 domain-containing protein [Bacillota bacterium]
MPRPPKRRKIKNIPGIKFFKPAGKPMRNLEETILSLEEVEAIRLKDREGLTQEEAAEKMDISRPTFQRILHSARGKIAEALLEGKALRFRGGDYRLAEGSYRCRNCGKVFHCKNLNRDGMKTCPHCQEPSLEFLPDLE